MCVQANAIIDEIVTVLNCDLILFHNCQYLKHNI